MIYSLESGLLDAHGRPVDGDEFAIIAHHFNARAASTAFDKTRAQLSQSNYWFGAAVALVCLLAGAAIMAGRSMAILLVLLGVGSAVALIVGVALLSAAKKHRPARRVSKIHRMYWPALRVEIGSRSALVDLSGAHDVTTLSYRTVADPSAIERLVEEIRRGEGPPPLESPKVQHQAGSQCIFGGEATLLQKLERATVLLRSTEEHRVEAGLVTAPDTIGRALQYAVPHMGRANAGPIVRVTDETDARVAFEPLAALHAVANETSSGQDDSLRELVTASAQRLVERKTARDTSRGLLTGMARASENAGMWTSFNFYCPHCNADPLGGLAPTTRMRQRSDDGEFYCPVCKRITALEHTITIDKFRDEVFNPIHDLVLSEAHAQIVSIDGGVRDQLQGLLDGHRATRRELSQKHRARQFESRAGIRRLAAQGASLQSQISATTTTLSKYRKLSEQMRAAFEHDCYAIAAAVKERGDRAVAEIDRRFQQRDTEAVMEEMRRVQINRQEEERRHQEQLAASKSIKESVDAVKASTDKVAAGVMMTEKQKEAARVGTFEAMTGVNPNPAKAAARWTNSKKHHATVRKMM